MKETGKQRAQRIALDYYRGAAPVERWKGRLGWGAFIVSVLWLLSAFAKSSEADFHGSRGQVAKVHQSINDNCSACHVSFQAISSHSWIPPVFVQAADLKQQKCQSCHDGPAHHLGQHPEMNCAACHREHQGVNGSLTRLPDGDCTQCHGNLAGHIQGNELTTPKDAWTVSRFAKGTHPEFRSTQSDPGKLKFNHKLHLSPGMALVDGSQKGGEIQTIGKIPEPSRTRYMQMQGATSLDEPVRLQCASCHVLDAGDFHLTKGQADPRRADARALADMLPQRAGGSYFLPIIYENQCQACHALETPDAKGAKVNLPHRVQPGDLKELLGNTFLAQAARGDSAILEHKLLPPLPGKKPTVPASPKVLQEVEGQLKFSWDFLFARRSKNACMECHDLQDDKGPWQATITPTQVPQIWLKNAKFDHKAHRAVDCQACHTKAAGSTVNTDVLIPDMANCVQCHAPHGRDAKGQPQGGVDFACTTCHLYHNRTRPDLLLEGLGARNRAPATPGTIVDFLQGNPKKK